MLTSYGCPYDAMPVEYEKSRKFGYSQDHDRTVVPATDHGKLVTASFFILLHCTTDVHRFAA